MTSFMMLLTSIASIDTMTIFSNAIALGKNSDKIKKFTRTRNYYYNSDKYKMNNEYDYYYQEEQQPQPSYNNNYGYFDNKKYL